MSGSCINGFTVKQAEKAIEILNIIYNKPFIIETLYHIGELGKEAESRYMWATVSDEEIKKVKEFFNGKI